MALRGGVVFMFQFLSSEIEYNCWSQLGSLTVDSGGGSVAPSTRMGWYGPSSAPRGCDTEGEVLLYTVGHAAAGLRYGGFVTVYCI